LYRVEHWLAGSLLLRLMATNGQRYTAAFSLPR
jgi:hypothetical protein